MQQPSAPTAHVDTFARDGLPPRELWPDMDYSVLPELAAYPDRLNAAVVLLDETVARSGERTAIRYGALRWSYRDLLERANRVARHLQEDMGVVPGNRVLLRGPNTPMMVACWLAVLKVGGVCVATMPLLRARELEAIIEKGDVHHAICDTSLAEELSQARQRQPRMTTVAHVSAEGSGLDPRADLDGALARKRPGFDNVATAADDVALLAFTSGTTGLPKATAHFHRDILAMCDAFPRHVSGASPDDVYVGTPPIAFTFGLGALLAFPMRFGSTVVFPTERATPEVLIETIREHRCTTLYTAPRMYRQLADAAGDHDLASLSTCVSAGETLPLPIYEAFHEATGQRIIDGIGTTEMIHIFISSAGDEIRPGTTGRVVAGYEARVVDEDGRELPPGEQGLLSVRGPTGCRYLNDVDRQRQYVRDGWNYPGDVYRVDADGYFSYQARADDMIISGGYNIAGPEVEAALLEHAKVGECAVVAAPDGQGGQLVKAFVVLRSEDDADDGLVAELQRHVKGQLAPYKYPRHIEFIDTLPRTATGKVQRFKLRDPGGS